MEYSHSWRMAFLHMFWGTHVSSVLWLPQVHTTIPKVVLLISSLASWKEKDMKFMSQKPNKPGLEATDVASHILLLRTDHKGGW